MLTVGSTGFCLPALKNHKLLLEYNESRRKLGCYGCFSLIIILIICNFIFTDAFLHYRIFFSTRNSMSLCSILFIFVTHLRPAQTRSSWKSLMSSTKWPTLYVLKPKTKDTQLSFEDFYNVVDI